MGIVDKKYTECLKRGEEALKKAHYAEAIELLERVLELKPEDVSARLSLSLAYLKKGEQEKAVQISKELVDSSPRTAYFHFNLGLVYSITKRFKEAKQEFLKAVKLKKNYPKAYVHLGALYERGGEYDKARLCYNRAKATERVQLLEKKIGEHGENANVQFDRKRKPEKVPVVKQASAPEYKGVIAGTVGVSEEKDIPPVTPGEKAETLEEKEISDLDMMVALEEEEAVSIEEESLKKEGEQPEEDEEKESEKGELTGVEVADIIYEQKPAARVEIVEGTPEWMCTFADMMSLLLTFFILLLSFSTIDLLKLKRAVGAFQEAFGMEAEYPGLSAPTVKPLAGTVTIDVVDKDGAEASMQGAKKVLEKFIEGGGLGSSVEVDIDTRGIVVQVRGKIMFQRGKAQLLPDSLPLLDTLAGVMREYPFKLSIEGHTDDIPIHTEQFPSNWELAAARAGSAIRYFVETLKLDANRICGVSYADTRPILPNITEDNRSKNRRVEFVFLNPA